MEFNDWILYLQVCQINLNAWNVIKALLTTSVWHISDDLKIHSWDGSAKDSAIKSIPLNKGTHILDIDCMNISQQSMDQRKRSSEMFAIGTSDGV